MKSKRKLGEVNFLGKPVSFMASPGSSNSFFNLSPVNYNKKVSKKQQQPNYPTSIWPVARPALKNHKYSQLGSSLFIPQPSSVSLFAPTSVRPAAAFWGDSDRDGMINAFDCDPFNRRKQGIVSNVVNAVKSYAQPLTSLFKPNTVGPNAAKVVAPQPQEKSDNSTPIGTPYTPYIKKSKSLESTTSKTESKPLGRWESVNKTNVSSEDAARERMKAATEFQIAMKQAQFEGGITGARTMQQAVTGKPSAPLDPKIVEMERIRLAYRYPTLGQTIDNTINKGGRIDNVINTIRYGVHDAGQAYTKFDQKVGGILPGGSSARPTIQAAGNVAKAVVMAPVNVVSRGASEAWALASPTLRIPAERMVGNIKTIPQVLTQQVPLSNFSQAAISNQPNLAPRYEYGESGGQSSTGAKIQTNIVKYELDKRGKSADQWKQLNSQPGGASMNDSTFYSQISSRPETALDNAYMRLSGTAIPTIINGPGAVLNNAIDLTKSAISRGYTAVPTTPIPSASYYPAPTGRMVNTPSGQTFKAYNALDKQAYFQNLTRENPNIKYNPVTQQYTATPRAGDVVGVTESGQLVYQPQEVMVGN